MRTPSMTEATIPIMQKAARGQQRYPLPRGRSLLSVKDVGSLGVRGPDHFLDELPVPLLPLRQHHLVTDLQSVLLRMGREFGVAEKRRNVHLVERVRYFVGLDRTGKLDRTLQDQASGVAARRMVAGLYLIFVDERLGELRRAWTEVGLESHLRFPLRGNRNANRGVTELGEFRAIGSDQQRHPLEPSLLLVQLAGKGGAIGIVTAAEQHVSVGGDDLVDDGREVRRAARV